jgi:adenylylsulfate kinase
MDAHPTGFVIWLTGMHAAGKSVLASNLARRFPAAGRRAELLDGDDPNEILTRGLGVTKEDRDTAVKRLGYVAKLLARNDAVVIVASLSPYREARDAVRRDVRRFVEVFVDCPMEKLLERDSEGLYKRALAGEVKNVSGIDDPYEPPTHAELVIHSDKERAEEATMRVLQSLVDLKYVGPAEFGKLTGGQRPRRSKGTSRAARRAAWRKLSAKAAARNLPKKMAARTAKAARGSRR